MRIHLDELNGNLNLFTCSLDEVFFDLTSVPAHLVSLLLSASSLKRWIIWRKMNEFNTLFKRTEEFSVNFSHNKIKSYKFRIEKCFGVFLLIFSFVFCTTRISRVRGEEAYVVQHEKCIYFIIVKRSPRCWAAYKSWWEVYSSRIIIQHFLNTGIVLAWVVPLFVALSPPPQTKFPHLLRIFIHSMAEGSGLRKEKTEQKSAQLCVVLTFCFVCYVMLGSRFKIFFPLPISHLWVN